MSLPGHDLDGIASVPEPIRYDWFTHNSTAAPDGTYYAGESQHNMVVVGILVGLIVVLCLILGFVAIPPIFGYIQSKMPVSPKRIERRYATIDGWLITKKIHEHDEFCDCAQRFYSKQREEILQQQTQGIPYKPQMVSSKCKGLLTAKNLMGRLASYPNRNTTTSEDEDPPKEVATDKSGSLRFCSDEIIVQDEECGHEDDSIDDDDSHKCLICLEKFQVEDVVSWASNDGCNHVFHHSCLRKWLLRKTNCPCCRNTVLSVDQPRPGKYPQRRRRLTTEEIGILASKRANRTTSTYFCIQEGLVELYGFAITTVTTTSPHSTKTLTNLSAVDTTTTSGGAGTPTTANQEEDDPKHPHHHYHHHHHHHHRWMRPRRFWQRNDKQGEEQQAAVDNEQVPTTPSTLRNDTFMEDDFSSSSSCSEDQDEGDDLEQGRRRTRRSKDTARPVELVFESEGDNQDEIDTKANKYDSEEQQYGEDERNESQSTENDSGSSDGATPVYATTLAVGAISANSTLLDNEPKEELTASREVVEEKEDEERILCA